MTVKFKPFKLTGIIDAPPSKSMAHRHLIGAALSGTACSLSGVDYSEDILASIDCLRSLGAGIEIAEDYVNIVPNDFMKKTDSVLQCRESGSTLRFFIPLALCLGKKITLSGSKRLLERPLNVYEELCRNQGFYFEKDKNSVTVCGNLKSGTYTIRGDISSQFISGLIFALIYLGGESTIKISPPFESRSYVDLTITALRSFGANIEFTDNFTIRIRNSMMHGYSGRIEGDYSNAAFLEAFNRIGSDICIKNLNRDSQQGDRVYSEYFDRICLGMPTLDISDCPDLGPVLFALSALKNGARFTGTDRLKAKESDRGAAIHEELSKLGGGLIMGDNEISVPKQNLIWKGENISSHNDHRIAMAMSVVLSQTGGIIDDAECVKKSYPGFFDDIIKLGANIELL